MSNSREQIQAYSNSERHSHDEEHSELNGADVSTFIESVFKKSHTNRESDDGKHQRLARVQNQANKLIQRGLTEKQILAYIGEDSGIGKAEDGFEMTKWIGGRISQLDEMLDQIDARVARGDWTKDQAAEFNKFIGLMAFGDLIKDFTFLGYGSSSNGNSN